MPDSGTQPVNRSPAAIHMAGLRPGGTRDRIIRQATQLFIARGFAGVSVAEIVAAAGAARSSFYRLFANRDEVLASIIRPVFESGVAAMRALAGQPPVRAIDGVLDMYLVLWRDRRDALRLATRMGHSHFRLFEDVHGAYRALLTDLMRRAQAEGILLNDSGDHAARIIARTAVDVLEVYDGDPRLAILFRRTMRGTLLKPAPN